MLLLCINRFIAKNIPIKTLLNMIDSSIKNLGQVVYDNQNWAATSKTQVWLKNAK